MKVSQNTMAKVYRNSPFLTVYAYCGSTRFQVITELSTFTSEPTEDLNDPGECSAMYAVPSACYDSGSEDHDHTVKNRV